MQEQLLVNPVNVFEKKLPTSRGFLGALVCEPESIHAGTIVFVPGFSGSREDFVAMLPELAKLGWHSFAIDQLGQPSSFGPTDESAFSIDLFAQDLIDIANSFPEPIHVVGHSFGGLVSSVAATKSTQSFASITLMCSGPGPMPKEKWGALPRLVEATTKYKMSTIWALKTIFEKLSGYRKFSRKVRVWRRNRWNNTNPLSIKVMATLLMHIHPVAQEFQKTLSVNRIPILVLSGAHDDIWPLSQQKEMAQTLNGTYVEIAGAGHSPAREEPLETVLALDKFLKAI